MGDTGHSLGALGQARAIAQEVSTPLLEISSRVGARRLSSPPLPLWMPVACVDASAGGANEPAIVVFAYVCTPYMHVTLEAQTQHNAALIQQECDDDNKGALSEEGRVAESIA